MLPTGVRVATVLEDSAILLLDRLMPPTHSEIVDYADRML
jgi:hypothetical protein